MWRRKIIVLWAVWASFIAAAENNDTQTPKSIDECANCETPECVHTASWILGNMNTNADPCDDFYEFACGNFMNSARKPSETYALDAWYMATQELDARLRSIVEDINKTKAPKHFRMVKTLYESCLHADQYTFTLEEYDNLYNKLHGPDGWPVLAGDTWNDMTVENGIFTPAFLKFDAQGDPKNASRLVFWARAVEPSLEPEILRLGLNNDIVKAYYNFMVDTARLLGADERRAKNELYQALVLEIELALDGVPEAKRWILVHNLDRMTVGEFVRKYPKLNLRHAIDSGIPYFYNVTDNDIIVVQGNMARLEDILARTSKRVVINLLTWRYLKSLMPRLTGDFRKFKQRFENVRSGTVTSPAKWQSCIEIVRNNLGSSLAALYQIKYMSQNIVNDITQMNQNIERQFYGIVQKTEWLDHVFKQEALTKIANMTGEFFYRDTYLTDQRLEDFYQELELAENDYYLNLENITTFRTKNYAARLRKPLDRHYWAKNWNFMTLDPAYLPFNNHYFIPQSLTIKNFYHVDRPKYINYATLGWPVSHEVSHSLDPENMYLDHNGISREWEPSETVKKFDERVKCIAEQYGNYTVKRVNLKLHGYRLAVENIADVAGIQIAYHAYLKWASENDAEKRLPGLHYTPNQIFWIAAGNSWCAKLPKAKLRYDVINDLHSPPKFRVNGAFANRPEFANDFKCKTGSNMNPVKKCSLW